MNLKIMKGLINIMGITLWVHSQNYEKPLLASLYVCMEQFGSYWMIFQQVCQGELKFN